MPADALRQPVAALLLAHQLDVAASAYPTTEEDTMRPSIGRLVHYVSYGTPGGEYASQCRAAIITEVDEEDGNHRVGLAVLNPTSSLRLLPWLWYPSCSA